MQIGDKWIAANPDLVAYESRRTGQLPEPASGLPESHRDPYWEAGVHPDLVEQLWDVLGPTLPVDCRWIFGGTPVLARPDTGVVFACPVGSHILGLRLPHEVREEALKAGALREWLFTGGIKFDISDVGDEWVIAGIRWSSDQKVTWLRRAYDCAGQDRD